MSDGPTPLDRIKALAPFGGRGSLAEYSELTYSWHGHGDGSGYEELRAKLIAGGSVEYRGVHHPGNGCCEGNPCRYCGAVSHE